MEDLAATYSPVPMWHSTMGAGGFHGRVRDGIGWGTLRQGHQVGQALRARGKALGGRCGVGGVCARVWRVCWERPAWPQ